MKGEVVLLCECVCKEGESGGKAKEEGDRKAAGPAASPGDGLLLRVSRQRSEIRSFGDKMWMCCEYPSGEPRSVHATKRNSENPRREVPTQ